MGIEPGITCILYWCLPDWVNLASVNWIIFNFVHQLTFGLRWVWLNRAWLHKDHKSLNLTSNVKIALSGRGQIRIKVVPGSILSVGNFYLLKYFCCMSLSYQHCQICVITEKLEDFNRLGQIRDTRRQHNPGRILFTWKWYLYSFDDTYNCSDLQVAIPCSK